ncbi:uncharacterized protein E0L32_011937 [Thyridium curvatum]|uniref:Uncharacterized protein n=1 Tax=Thyridium curvatum TaxID=1093900 RepID=A0A507BMM7_9PEZI|nr:uncharacterized protein E0L32_011937 [Thyridium curvatum]TPX17990.1 hypothetical protein E0L32_011937 [Thyridium curvatum]
MTSTTMNRYWIPQEDIHKKVISSEIQHYLGPDATVRAYSKDGEDGYLITTPGPCFSDEQIDELRVKSKEMWNRQAALRSESGEKEVPLKRPLHPPVIISRGGEGGASRRRRPLHRWYSHHLNLYNRNLTIQQGSDLSKADPDLNTDVIDLQPMSRKHHISQRSNEQNEFSSSAVSTSASNLYESEGRHGKVLGGMGWDKSCALGGGEESHTDSGTSIDEGHKSAGKELAQLLLRRYDISDAGLALLSTFGPMRLQDDLARTLSHFGRDLKREASSPTEQSAVHFVIQSRKRIAASMVEALILHRGHETLGFADVTTNNDKEHRIQEDLGLEHHIKSPVEEVWTDQDAEVDESEIESEIISNLDCVKSFIANSKALRILSGRFKYWPIEQGRVDQQENHCSFDHEEEQRSSNVQTSDQQGHNMSTSLPDSEGANLNSATGGETVISEDFQLLDPITSSEREHHASTNTPMDFTMLIWKQRCGRRLQLTVPKENETALRRFIQNTAASGSPPKASSTTSDSDGPYERHTSRSSSQALASTSASESDRANTVDTDPSSVGSDEEGPQYPDAAPGTRKYLLLCAKSGVHRISLAHIDLTNMNHDEVLFQHIRTEYARLRGRAARNPFLVPRTMHYIKLQLVFRHKSKECVGNFYLDTADSIPPPKHVREGLYTYKPCPVDMPPFPIHPHVFMHSFLYPGDHCGSQIFQRLPKKMHCQLSCQDDPFQTPMGWGICIVDGFDWRLLRILVLSTVLVSCVVTVLWSALMKDVQGGTGMGQYAMALLAMSLTVIGLELAYGNLDSCM